MVGKPKSDFETTDRHLAIGVLAPPVIWFAHLNISYALVPSQCDSGARWGLHLTTIVALLMVAGAGILSWRILQRMGEGPTDSGAEIATRRRFMAILGTGFAAAFAIVILAAEVPNVMLRSCG